MNQQQQQVCLWNKRQLVLLETYASEIHNNKVDVLQRNGSKVEIEECSSRKRKTEIKDNTKEEEEIGISNKTKKITWVHVLQENYHNHNIQSTKFNLGLAERKFRVVDSHQTVFHVE